MEKNKINVDQKSSINFEINSKMINDESDSENDEFDLQVRD